VTNLQFCLVVGIPTLAAVFGIVMDRTHYKGMMAGFDRIDERFDRLDALFDRFDANFDARR
jgi:hypothetical protein